MARRESWKADKKALVTAKSLIKRQRRNMKAYIAIIRNTQRALEANDLVRALALVSYRVKYPPDLLIGLDCDHKMQHCYVEKCMHCGLIEDNL